MPSQGTAILEQKPIDFMRYEGRPTELAEAITDTYGLDGSPPRREAVMHLSNSLTRLMQDESLYQVFYLSFHFLIVLSELQAHAAKQRKARRDWQREGMRNKGEETPQVAALREAYEQLEHDVVWLNNKRDAIADLMLLLAGRFREFHMKDPAAAKKLYFERVEEANSSKWREHFDLSFTQMLENHGDLEEWKRDFERIKALWQEHVGTETRKRIMVQIKDELGQTEDRIQSVEGQIAEAERLKQEKVHLEAELALLQTRKAELEGEFKKLRHSADDLITDYHRLEALLEAETAVAIADEDLDTKYERLRINYSSLIHESRKLRASSAPATNGHATKTADAQPAALPEGADSADADTLRQQIEVLSEDLQSASIARDEAEIELRSLEESIETMREEHDRTRSELSDYRQMVATLEAERGGARHTTPYTRDALARRQAAANAPSDSDLTADGDTPNTPSTDSEGEEEFHAEMPARVEVDADEISELRTLVADLQESLEMVRHERDTKQEDLKALREQLSQGGDGEQTVEQEVEEERQRARLLEVERHLEEAREELGVLRPQLGERFDKVEELEKELSSRKDLVRDLQVKVDDLSDQLTHAQGRAARADEAEGLTKRVAELEMELDALRIERDALKKDRSSIDRKAEKLETREMELDELRAKLEAAGKEVPESLASEELATPAATRAELESVRNQRDELASRAAQLESTIEDRDQRISSLESELERLRAASDAAPADAVSNDELQAISTRLSGVERERDRLKDSADRTRSQLDSMRKEVERAEATLREDLDQLREESERWQEMAEKNQERLDQANERNRELREQVSQGRKMAMELAQLQSDLETLKHAREDVTEILSAASTVGAGARGEVIRSQLIPSLLDLLSESSGADRAELEEKLAALLSPEG